MPLTNAAESVTLLRRTTTDVIAPALRSATPLSATKTRDKNTALAAGAHEAAIENEQHAERAVSNIREVLEPYDE